MRVSSASFEYVCADQPLHKTYHPMQKSKSAMCDKPRQWQWPSLMFIWKLIHTWSLVQLAILLCLEVLGVLTTAPRLLSDFPTFQSAWQQFEILLESPGCNRATQLLFGCLVISYLKHVGVKSMIAGAKFCVSNRLLVPWNTFLYFAQTVIESAGHRILFHLRNKWSLGQS